MCGIEKRNLSGPMQTAYRDAALPALFGGSEDAMQGLWPRHPSDSLRQVQQNSGSLPVDALPPQSGRCTADSLLGLAQCDIDPALFGTTDDPCASLRVPRHAAAVTRAARALPREPLTRAPPHAWRCMRNCATCHVHQARGLGAISHASRQV